MDWRVDIDYLEIDVQVGDDLYLLSTDGIHQFINDKELTRHCCHVAAKRLEARCEELLIACAETVITVTTIARASY
jgi:hypothetical protein